MTTALSVSVPVVETDRLILRAARREDFEPYLAMVRADGSLNLSAEEAWRKFTSAAGSWLVLGYGFWSIERKCDSRFIGRAGFGEFHRDVRPRIDDLPEVGWRITGELWGRGYATEAARGCLAWADLSLSRKVFALVEPANAASARVAQKAGFKRAGTRRYGDVPIDLYERPPSV